MDIFHLHWPEMAFWGTGQLKGMLRGLRLLIALLVLKSRGVKIVWTVHNLEPHDSSDRFIWFWRPYIYVVSFLVDGFITLSPSTVGIARDSFRNLTSKPSTFLWHPEYPVSDRQAAQRAETRQQLGISGAEKVFAFIGQIRPYKGVEELIDCFIKAQNPHIRLVIAGGVNDQRLKSRLIKSADEDHRIVRCFGHLAEDEFASIAGAADVVVLPFRKIFHSGSVIYALSAGKQLITPSGPFARDLQSRVGEGWMKLYDDVLLPDHFSMLEAPVSDKPNLDFLSIALSGTKAKEFYLSLR